MKLGFSNPFEFAVYSELQSQKGDEVDSLSSVPSFSAAVLNEVIDLSNLGLIAIFPLPNNILKCGNISLDIDSPIDRPLIGSVNW
jgi:hypothetical protein